ncbi:MAG: hypothetical protein HYW05_01920 [Candidatus Diapherotrites archaeon]|nr:hypothetical protein [Candidatus Diapherotrites archaeon]
MLEKVQVRNKRPGGNESLYRKIKGTWGNEARMEFGTQKQRTFVENWLLRRRLDEMRYDIPPKEKEQLKRLKQLLDRKMLLSYDKGKSKLILKKGAPEYLKNLGITAKNANSLLEDIILLRESAVDFDFIATSFGNYLNTSTPER